MCSHYEAPTQAQLLIEFGVVPDRPVQTELWPGYTGPFLRRPHTEDFKDEEVPEVEAIAGVFGLLPFWAKDTKLARRTYNARSETVAEKPSYRSAWKQAHHCIIPANAFYEPDWRSGKAVPTRIARTDGRLMGIAGLWERWVSPAGEVVFSYTMLTVNADAHPLMRDYHRPGDEKRMVAILPRGLYRDWLRASAEGSSDFLKPFPADRLVAIPEH